ncbi:uncharacterized protein LOC129766543 [Toxorhynchites rutilus septentrionalis]|uniref:uncharacterized protein LOC129766543 n=1 Tax=Toxorhynchites rutilus septentrionalis TaxID=329112 RepID=UPI00247A5322|nr:uncharacterized protein LOC129766543 [Toxorhynchites rutilus septentrionalis]
MELQQLEDEKKLKERLVQLQIQEEKEMRKKENSIRELAVQQERMQKKKERNEMKRMEEEYLSKKYTMMQDNDDESVKSHRSATSETSKVKHCVNLQQIQTSEAVSQSVLSEMKQPHTHRQGQSSELQNPPMTNEMQSATAQQDILQVRRFQSTMLPNACNDVVQQPVNQTSSSCNATQSAAAHPQTLSMYIHRLGMR